MHDYYFVMVMVTGAIIFLLFLFFIVFYMLYHKRRIQQEYMAKEKLIYDHNTNLLKARLEEQEGVMSQISREIHDNVAQKVDFLQMNSKALQDDGANAANTRILHNISALADQIGNDLRNISYTLNSEYITAHGLDAVLRKELEYIQASRSIACSLELEGELPVFAAESELLIYRIVQEALHNSMKHASASEIGISIRSGDDFRICIHDNGKGFDPAALNDVRTGLGLKSMQQRADMLGASFTIDAIAGQCTDIILEIDAGSLQKVRSGQVFLTQ